MAYTDSYSIAPPTSPPLSPTWYPPPSPHSTPTVQAESTPPPPADSTEPTLITPSPHSTPTVKAESTPPPPADSTEPTLITPHAWPQPLLQASAVRGFPFESTVLTYNAQHPELTTAESELAVSTRGRRLRKANVLSLNMCTCGVTIADSEINAGRNIMRCRVSGCETVWVRSSFTAWFCGLLVLSYTYTLISSIRLVWATRSRPKIGLAIVV